jgi:hypothetical protein
MVLTYIVEEFRVTALEEKLCTYRHNWFQHIHRMEDYRLAKQFLNNHSTGRRRPGRPPRRLLEDVSAETETGHPGLTSSWNIMMILAVRSRPERFFFQLRFC